jgi:imidazolonepropionase-like amidohydrolase
MKLSSIRVLYFLLFSFALFSCSHQQQYDLAITNVKVFDAENKKVLEDQTILINADTIVSVISSKESFNAKKTIEGKGRLVSPGFFDTHTHLGNILGDYEKAPIYISKDSVSIYRKRIAETFLKYGVTTIKDVGQPEQWIKESLKWQQHPTPDFPNIFICGSALISDEDRVPYIGHIEVKDPEDAARKVQEYHDMGINYLKLYSRLRIPEFKAVMKKASELNMNTCAHLEYNVPIDSALSYGLKNFEHLLTLQSSVLNSNADWMDYNSEFQKKIKLKSFIPPIFEAFRYIENKPLLKEKMNVLIEKMANEHAYLSTAIHVLASYTGRSYFRTFIVNRLNTEEIPEVLTDAERKLFNEDFDIMMNLLKIAHQKGVKITIGTDCSDGGKAVLSELLLLHESGFSIEDILQITTINGANSMGLGNKYGSISAGKKADLVIFEKNPFDNYKNFLSEKIVIKDGKVYKN